jgi:hypothetical protein
MIVQISFQERLICHIACSHILSFSKLMGSLLMDLLVEFHAKNLFEHECMVCSNHGPINVHLN